MELDEETYQLRKLEAQRTRSFRTFDEFTRFWAQDRPEQLAFADDSVAMDFKSFEDSAARVAGMLKACGLGKGDRIAWLGKNSTLYFVLLHGAVRAGVIMVPIGWRLAEPEAAFIIDDAKASLLFLGNGFESLADSLGKRPSVKGCFTTPDTYHAIGEAERSESVEADADDPALQLYTSGTTGSPKGAVLTNRNFFELRSMSLDAPPPHTLSDANDKVLIATPCSHIGGTGPSVLALWSGLGCIVLPEFDPKQVLEVIGSHSIAQIFLVPAALQLLLNHPDCAQTDFSRLKYILYGASPIPLDLLRESIAMFGAEFVQSYGLTETTGGIAALLPEDHSPEGNVRMRSTGKPMTGVEIEIRDIDGRALPVGAIGEICIRSPSNMLGYWNLPEETAETLSADGWLRSGDVGYLDEDGYVYLYDRARDMIISGGENVYPAEVESAIYGHPDVMEVAVIGVPDSNWGEAVKAICVPKDGHTLSPASVITWARRRIAGFKVPKSVDIVDVLPRNASGKILRRELRERYWQGQKRRIN